MSGLPGIFFYQCPELFNGDGICWGPQTGYTHHLCCAQLWSPQYKKDMDLLE